MQTLSRLGLYGQMENNLNYSTMEIISKGNDRSKSGWTINSPFSIDESYFD